MIGMIEVTFATASAPPDTLLVLRSCAPTHSTADLRFPCQAPSTSCQAHCSAGEPLAGGFVAVRSGRRATPDAVSVRGRPLLS